MKGEDPPAARLGIKQVHEAGLNPGADVQEGQRAHRCREVDWEAFGVFVDLRLHAGQREAGGLGFNRPTAEYRTLRGRGVRFTMGPERQSWGGYMSMFADPEGNIFYLDQLR